MKIIDILNKIANDEEVPKKIKFREKIYTYNSKTNWYVRETDTFYNGYEDLFVGYDRLNDTVEILEEEKKIPEKINISNFPRHNNSLKKTAIKVNQVIDYLKNKGE